jgi:GSH-dependent disulfide-bond oxidoreductase
MTKLTQFPITTRWPAAHPDRLQLYSLPAPNGVKVSIMLEETGIPYEVHKIDFARQDQKTLEYLSLNPNAKIPAIIDPDGPGGVLADCPVADVAAERSRADVRSGRIFP